MVIVEPFVYQKITAFKERVQIISKVNEIIDKINNGEIGVPEDRIIELIENELLNYYTKAEVDDAISNIDLSIFYTKSETDNLLDLKRNITDSYSKSEIDTKETTINNKIDEKQDILTPIFPLSIDESNNLKMSEFELYTDGFDWTELYTQTGGSAGPKLLKYDTILIIGRNTFYFPKDTNVSSITLYTPAGGNASYGYDYGAIFIFTTNSIFSQFEKFNVPVYWNEINETSGVVTFTINKSVELKAYKKLNLTGESLSFIRVFVRR